MREVLPGIRDVVAEEEALIRQLVAELVAIRVEKTWQGYPLEDVDLRPFNRYL